MSEPVFEREIKNNCNFYKDLRFYGNRKPDSFHR